MIHVQIHYYRHMDTQWGQATLDAMGEKIKENPEMHGKWGRVVVEGNRSSNPFPKWAQSAIEKSGFKYDSFNLCYVKEVEDEAAGVSACEAFDGMFRSWAKSKGYKGIDHMQIFAMSDHEDLRQVDTY